MAGTAISIVGFARDRAEIDAYLYALTALDTALLSLARYPAIYQSGVRYQQEPTRLREATEDFAPVTVVIARGWGDCDDLAAWRAAELRVTGADAAARAVIVPSPGDRQGARRWHAVVKRSDGRLEDAARTLAQGRVTWI